MRIFQTIVRRVTTAAAGAGYAVISTVTTALSLSSVITGTSAKPTVNVGLVAAQMENSTLLVDQKPAVSASLLGASGAAAYREINAATLLTSRVDSAVVEKPLVNTGLLATLLGASGAPLVPTHLPAVLVSLLSATGTPAAPPATPAVRLSTVIADHKKTDVPAADIVQVTYALVRRVGAATQAAVGTAWTNGANALGTNSGAPHATCVGTIGGNTNGIELNYLNHVLKGEFVITDARLFVYAAGVDATGLLLDTTISYNIGAGLVTLEVIAGAFSNLTTPREYALPLLNTWTEYDALAARVVCVFAAASVAANASLDAIEIQITASKVDTL